MAFFNSNNKQVLFLVQLTRISPISSTFFTLLMSSLIKADVNKSTTAFGLSVTPAMLFMMSNKGAPARRAAAKFEFTCALTPNFKRQLIQLRQQLRQLSNPWSLC